MNFTFRRKRISGILVVVPENERTFVEEMKNFNFPEARSLKLKEVMGFDKRRVVAPGNLRLAVPFRARLVAARGYRCAAAGHANSGPLHARNEQLDPGPFGPEE
jgi:hypothetical protein